MATPELISNWRWVGISAGDFPVGGCLGRWFYHISRRIFAISVTVDFFVDIYQAYIYSDWKAVGMIPTSWWTWTLCISWQLCGLPWSKSIHIQLHTYTYHIQLHIFVSRTDCRRICSSSYTLSLSTQSYRHLTLMACVLSSVFFWNAKCIRNLQRLWSTATAIYLEYFICLFIFAFFHQVWFTCMSKSSF